MKKERKHYAAGEKVAILRRHLVEQLPVSELRDNLGLQPTVFYRSRKEFFENGAAAFQQKGRPDHSAEQERIACLQKKIQTKDEVLAELMAEYVAVKRNAWGTLTGVWVPHDTRDQIVDFVRRWSEKTEIGAGRFIEWLDVAASKFYDWRELYGKVNEHNGWVPRDFWLEDWEKQAIIGYHLKNPLEGYRRLTFMMLDAVIVAVSPSSVWRVLSQAGLLSKWKGKPSKKLTGSEQALGAHQHWHINVSYLNISGTFYYLCSILDGYSRYIVHWDLRERMTEADIEITVPSATSRRGTCWPGVSRKSTPRATGSRRLPDSNGRVVACVPLGERWGNRAGQRYSFCCILSIKTPTVAEQATRKRIRIGKGDRMRIHFWGKMIARCAMWLCACFAVATVAQCATIQFGGTLTGSQENPATGSAGTGLAVVTWDQLGNTLEVAVTFSGLTGITTASHIHCCVAPPGNIGVATTTPTFPGFPLGVTSGSYDQVFDLGSLSTYNATFVSANGGTAAGAAAALTTGLQSGGAYLNIHTNTSPGGEIRAFLTEVPEPASAPLAAASLLGLWLLRRCRR